MAGSSRTGQNECHNSTVPKFTLIVGNSHGAGTTPCRKGLRPQAYLGWPTAQIAVMSGPGRKKHCCRLRGRPKAQGKTIAKEEEDTC